MRGRETIFHPALLKQRKKILLWSVRPRIASAQDNLRTLDCELFEKPLIREKTGLSRGLGGCLLLPESLKITFLPKQIKARCRWFPPKHRFVRGFANSKEKKTYRS